MRWTVTLIAALITACASQTKFEAPTLNIVNIEMLEGSSFFTQRMKVHVRVQNPNDQELPIKGVSAKLELQGEKFATGVSAESFTVPAFGEAEFDLLVDASVARAVIGMIGKGKTDQLQQQGLDYRLTGKVSLSSGLIRSIPFDETGNFKPPAETAAQSP
ncbi:MAG TPA: LEA type 2 family protein [Steroidobacteraceae bacterium]|jgi:LEA14-like dessication related protein|nr:LEA type 2 family protein [Steroidobacteraceae bacterium]